jgi:beta-lactamase regulating signal transducer with metallopeptidase domain
MSNGLKTGLYIVSTVLVVGLITVLAVQLLVWVLPIILGLYIFFKIKGYINNKKGKSSSSTSYNSESKSNYSNNYSTNADDDSVGEVIDVEYQDVNK